ncbi:ultraviolet-B receptor UVR8 [Canna indica]|uniref:Ultraviolet-B receptor UVR8 n=1 Tax=Canna indica TaxID=4628 RepID=A0AAQ3L4S2_9LILI|nr:ultraviolet-B receptor UVR8 [Canna indica]
MESARSVVLAWGSGEDGQLGMGVWEGKDWVHSIKSLETKNVVAVVAGSRNSLAICGNGQAAIGGWHCLAVDDQGRAYAWGMKEKAAIIQI